MAEHLPSDAGPDQVVVGIGTDRGGWVQALLSAAYQVFAINPLSAARYRDRHVISRAKSDPGDAHVLADLVRTDRHQHRPIAGVSELAEAVKVLARSHQNLIWTRERQTNGLRSTLREFYPAALVAFGDDLAGRDALGVLAKAQTPAKGGCPAGHADRGGAARGRPAQPAQPGGTDRDRVAQRAARRADAGRRCIRRQHVRVGAIITEMVRPIGNVEVKLAAPFEQHPSAEILCSLPGLGVVPGARVLAEFGDDPHRYADAKARKNYAGTAPITRASGKSWVVLARVARNRGLADALYQRAFSALSRSPGARAYHDTKRAAGATHHAALRALANRLVGLLHGCLGHDTTYDEATAWHLTSGS